MHTFNNLRKKKKKHHTHTKSIAPEVGLTATSHTARLAVLELL